MFGPFLAVAQPMQIAVLFAVPAWCDSGGHVLLLQRPLFVWNWVKEAKPNFFSQDMIRCSISNARNFFRLNSLRSNLEAFCDVCFPPLPPTRGWRMRCVSTWDVTRVGISPWFLCLRSHLGESTEPTWGDDRSKRRRAKVARSSWTPCIMQWSGAQVSCVWYWEPGMCHKTETWDKMK